MNEGTYPLLAQLKFSLVQRLFWINSLEPYGKAIVVGPYPMGAEGMAKAGAELGAHFQKARFFNQSGFQLQTELICKFLQ